MKRRRLLTGLGALGLAGCAAPSVTTGAAARVVVVGGGYGGATAAKYLRLLSEQRIDVLMVEPEAAFVSCPLSNLVLSGDRSLTDLTRPYDTLGAAHGVRLVRDRVVRVDTGRRTAELGSGTVLPYDKLVLSPGVEMIWDEVAGLREASRDGVVLQAWKAGPETLALRRQLEAMPPGGVCVITVPEAPYRCPPGPYERASLIASYFKARKPRAKVLILDANEDVTSKGPLFKRVWAETYKGMVEYRPLHKATAVDAATRTVRFEIQEDVRADVLNVLPPMRAGAIATQAGLVNGRWCPVHWHNLASTAAPHVHVIGDAVQSASAMPKSGHMANSQAKVLAAALVAELAGWEPDPAPMLTNTCYSHVDGRRAMHVASVHAYDAAAQTFSTVPGSGGLSAAPNELEAALADSWARSIWADMLA